MRALTDNELFLISGGSEESYAAGEAAGEAVGEALMKGMKIVGTISGIVALAIMLS